MSAISNLDAATASITGNTGSVAQNLEPGIPRAYVLIPRGTIIPPSAMVSQAAFYAYLCTASATGTIADARKNRAFPILYLDTFDDMTKEMGSTDSGLYQLETIRFNTKYSARFMGNKATYQEVFKFNNCQNIYSMIIVDARGQVWACKDPAGTEGASGYTLLQFTAKDWKPPTTKDGVPMYTISVQFANRLEFNENFRIYDAGLDSDNIPGLTNAVMQDVSSTLGTPLTITTTTDIVAIMKAGTGSIDLASPAYYQSALTKECFSAKNLTAGTTLTITTLTKGTIVVANQVYNYLWFILSAAPTSGNVVQIALNAPSAVNAIIPNFNSVTEIISAGVDGANAAVHTFA